MKSLLKKIWAIFTLVNFIGSTFAPCWAHIDVQDQYLLEFQRETNRTPSFVLSKKSLKDTDYQLVGRAAADGKTDGVAFDGVQFLYCFDDDGGLILDKLQVSNAMDLVIAMVGDLKLFDFSGGKQVNFFANNLYSLGKIVTNGNLSASCNNLFVENGSSISSTQVLKFHCCDSFMSSEHSQVLAPLIQLFAGNAVVNSDYSNIQGQNLQILTNTLSNIEGSTIGATATINIKAASRAGQEAILINRNSQIEADYIAAEGWDNINNNHGIIAGKKINLHANTGIKTTDKGTIIGTELLGIRTATMQLEDSSFNGGAIDFALDSLQLNNGSVGVFGQINNLNIHQVALQRSAFEFSQAVDLKVQNWSTTDESQVFSQQPFALQVSKQFVNSHSTIEGQQEVKIASGDPKNKNIILDNNHGIIRSGSKTDLDAGKGIFSNLAGEVVGEAVTVLAQKAINNEAGRILGQQSTRLNSQLVNNEFGVIQSSNVQIQIDSPFYQNFVSNPLLSYKDWRQQTDRRYFLHGTLNNKQGMIVSGNRLNLTTPGVIWNEGGTILAGPQESVINADFLFNNEQGGVVKFAAFPIAPPFLGRPIITSKGLIRNDESSKIIFDAGGVINSLNGSITNEGLIQNLEAFKCLDIIALELITNQNNGIISSLGSMTLKSIEGSIYNCNAKISCLNDLLTLIAKNYTQYGADTFCQGKNLNFILTGLLSNNGGAQILSEELAVEIAGLDNAGGIIGVSRLLGNIGNQQQLAVNDIGDKFSSVNKFSQVQEQVRKQGADAATAPKEEVSISNTSAAIDYVTAKLGSLINAAGKIYVRELLALEVAKEVSNSDRGEIISQGPLSLIAAGRILNQDDSNIISEQDQVRLTSKIAAIINETGSQISSYNGTTLQTRVLRNNKGTVSASQGALQFIPTKQLDGEGVETECDNEYYINNVGGILHSHDSILFPEAVRLDNEDGNVNSDHSLIFASFKKFVDNTFSINNKNGVLEAEEGIDFGLCYVKPSELLGRVWANDVIKYNYQGSLLLNDSLNPQSQLIGFIANPQSWLELSLNLLYSEQNISVPLNMQLTLNSMRNKGKFDVKGGLDLVAQKELQNRSLDADDLLAFDFPVLSKDPNLSHILKDEDKTFGWSDKPIKALTAVISAQKGMRIKTPKLDNRTGVIESGGDLSLKLDKAFHGTPYNEPREVTLPNGNKITQPYFKSLPSYIVSAGHTSIVQPEDGQFLNLFGDIIAEGGLDYKGGLFFNYAGNIYVPQSVPHRFQAKNFINAVGVLRQHNLSNQLHMFDTQITAPASLHTLGSLDLSGADTLNLGSSIYAKLGIIAYDGSFQNQHVHLHFDRTYTLRWTENSSHTKRHRLGGRTTHNTSNECSKDIREQGTSGIMLATASAGGEGIAVKTAKTHHQSGIMHAPTIEIEAPVAQLGPDAQNIALQRAHFNTHLADAMYEATLAHITRLEGLFDSYPDAPSLLTPRHQHSYLPPLSLVIVGDDFTQPLREGLPKLAVPLATSARLLSEVLQANLGTAYLPSLKDLAHGCHNAAEFALTFPHCQKRPVLDHYLDSLTNRPVLWLDDKYLSQVTRPSIFFYTRSMPNGELALFPQLILTDNHGLSPHLLHSSGSTVAQSNVPEEGVLDLNIPGGTICNGYVSGTTLLNEGPVAFVSRTHEQVELTKFVDAGGKKRSSFTNEKYTPVVNTKLEEPAGFEIAGDSYFNGLALEGAVGRISGNLYAANDSYISLQDIETQAVVSFQMGSKGGRATGVRPVFNRSDLEVRGKVFAETLRQFVMSGSRFVSHDAMNLHAEFLQVYPMAAAYIMSEVINGKYGRRGGKLDGKTTEGIVTSRPQIGSLNGDFNLSALDGAMGGCTIYGGQDFNLGGGSFKLESLAYSRRSESWNKKYKSFGSKGRNQGNCMKIFL